MLQSWLFGIGRCFMFDFELLKVMHVLTVRIGLLVFDELYVVRILQLRGMILVELFLSWVELLPTVAR